MGTVPDPRVYLRPHDRINGVHGDGHMGDLETGKASGVIGETKTVGGKAQYLIRMTGVNHFHNRQGLFRIGKRVSGTGYTDNSNTVDFLQSPVKIGNSLKRGKNPARDTGTVFVRAVVFPVAEVTLNVTLPRHRKVYPPGTVADFRVKTRMISKIHFSIFFYGVTHHIYV
jgi:hypothetical protein